MTTQNVAAKLLLLSATLLLTHQSTAFLPAPCAMPLCRREGGRMTIGGLVRGGQISRQKVASVPLRRAGNTLSTRTTKMTTAASGSGALDAMANLFLAVGLSADDSKALINAGAVVTADKGDQLMDDAKDDLSNQAKKLYLVVDGEISLTRGGKLLSVLGKGEFLGETRFLEMESLQTLQKLRETPLEEIFSRFDDDRSAGISSAELIRAAQEIDIDFSEAQAAQFIKMIDANQDGEISMDEAKKAVDDLKVTTKTLFKKADMDKSGSLSASEVAALLKEQGIDIDVEQASNLMGLLGGSRDNVSLTAAMDSIYKVTSSGKLKTKFAEYDRDGNDRIDVNEFARLLADFGVSLSIPQMSLLFESVDMNNDGLLDFREFDIALDRVKNNTVQRWKGDATRLYDTVAFKTQQRSQIKSKVSTATATYVMWDFESLARFFAERPQAADTIRRQWALQLTDRLRGATEKLGPLNVANAESGRSSQQISAPGYSVKNVHPGNYGYGGEFTYGQSGDYGPLDKAVPANFLTTATWNFGREYRALRRFFGYEEFRELVDALSGAGAWEKARRGLEELVGSSGLDEKERKEKFAQAFRSMDKDGNGSVTVKELQDALESIGIVTLMEGAKRMIAAADVDKSDSVSESEFVDMVEAVLAGKAQIQAAFRKRKGWFPPFLVKPLVWFVEQIARLDDKTEAKLGSRLRPTRNTAKVDQETQRLRNMLGLLKLDNDAVWKREESRMELLQESLQQARTEKTSGFDEAFVRSLEAAKSPGIIMGPYFFLCWLLDVLFINRPIQRFWFLETVARMPYFSYITMLTLYESLGWWRASSDVRRVHFAEEWNEVQHLKIMEALGGDRSWFDRFMARHAAVFYYVILNHVWLFSPSIAYNFSELIEFHAVDTYGEFVDTNEALLKSLPAPKEALEYYGGDDLFLFDEFQTGRDPASRRPLVRNLYDVFCNIRDDELEHVKTMFQCQTAEAQIISRNTRKAREDARARN